MARRRDQAPAASRTGSEADPRARLRAVRRLAPPVVRKFQRALLAWYGRHGRDLPWRRTRVPYRVLVSEIMLQQTQVDRVVPKYRQFLRVYPSLRALAAADVEDVRRLWYPLGYNIRPVRLHAIARETMARYGGAPSRRRGDAARPAGHRPIHGGRAAVLRLRPRRGDPRHQRPPRPRPRLLRAAQPEAPARRSPLLGARGVAGPRRARLRLQPGADGLRCHLVHAPRAALRPLSDACVLRA